MPRVPAKQQIGLPRMPTKAELIEQNEQLGHVIDRLMDLIVKDSGDISDNRFRRMVEIYLGFAGHPETHVYMANRDADDGSFKRGARHVAVMIRRMLEATDKEL